MKIEFLTPEEWGRFSSDAHLICFGESDYAAIERIDFAFLGIDESPVCYGTARELDSESLYLHWGGAFPNIQGTVKSYKAYSQIIDELKTRYKFLTTAIKNTNTPMLKFAMKVGFRIRGIRVFKNEVYLEHFLEV